MVISKRRFIETSDAGFIVDSMPKEIYFDNKESRRGRVNQTWFKNFHEYLLGLFKTAHIVIATDKEDPEFILGYAIFQDKQLEFVYVKEAYRKQGIGTMLVEDSPYETTNEKNMTKIAHKILGQRITKVEETLTNQEKNSEHSERALEQKEMTPAKDPLTASAISVITVKFQSALLSGFNAAENDLSTKSSNKMRRADSIWYTPHGVIVDQNGHRFIVPLANVIKADIK